MHYIEKQELNLSTTNRKVWVELPNFSRTVSIDKFIDATLRALGSLVVPEVKSKFNKGHPAISVVTRLYKSSTQLIEFINQNKEKFAELTFLSTRHLSMLSQLLISNITPKIVESFHEYLSEFDFNEIFSVPDKFLSEQIFIDCELVLEEGLRHLQTTAQIKQQIINSSRKIEYSNDRRLRRLDALAELLELDPNVSLCTAVTIFDGKLIISANNSKDFSNREISEKIIQKLNIIRDFIKSKLEISIMPFDDFVMKPSQSASPVNKLVLESVAEDITDESEHGMDLLQHYYKINFKRLTSIQELSELVSLLQTTSRSLHPVDDLVQNLWKLLKTFCLDIGPFSSIEKYAILNSNCLVLLPAVQHGRSVMLSIETFDGPEYTPEDASGVSVFKSSPKRIGVGEFPSHLKASNFHCEQLIFYYLQLMDVERAQIGISKACCVTCNSVFQANPFFQIRGTSGQLYPNTANITEKSSAVSFDSPIRYPNKCSHQPSPGFTPGDLGESLDNSRKRKAPSLYREEDVSTLFANYRTKRMTTMRSESYDFLAEFENSYCPK